MKRKLMYSYICHEVSKRPLKWMDDQRHNPINSYSLHQMGVNDEFHEPAALSPRKDIRYPFDRTLRQQVSLKGCGTCLPNYTAWLGMPCSDGGSSRWPQQMYSSYAFTNTQSRIRRGLALTAGRSGDKILQDLFAVVSLLWGLEVTLCFGYTDGS